MKTVKVIPLFKTGDRYEFSNYRPVSVLPQFSKILENVYWLILLKVTKFCAIVNLAFAVIIHLWH